MKSIYRNLRRWLMLFWGKQWKVRSLFIPSHVRRNSIQFLKEQAGNLFFVLGTGRSGTQLITDLLVQSNEAAVFHEPNFASDVGDMDALRRNRELSLEYWREFRSLEIAKRWKAQPEARLYGEVSGVIRFHVPSIQELYPEANLFLVSRDGRGVIRSVMGWPQFYSPSSKGAYALEPLPDDPYCERWSEMSRFEKICWGWMDTNEYLMRYIPPERCLQLEQLASDYEYCMSRLLEPLGIMLTHESWQNHVSRKSRNASSAYSFPAWNEWQPAQKKSFEEICGSTMSKLGYVL